MLITLSVWSQSLLPYDIDMMLVIFEICQVVSSWCAVLSHSLNRLDLVMTDVPGIVDVVIGTPIGTSDHSFVSCVLCVDQSVPEINVRSTVFLKHRTN